MKKLLRFKGKRVLIKRVSGSANLSYNELNLIIEERSSSIREKFGEEVIRGIEDSELLEILNVIKVNRKDFLRPALASFSYEAVGGLLDAADDAGLMFTLVSTGISIHDDIIDKSPNKHLRVTILGKYGLNKSLLVGDLLIVKGWSKISNILVKNQNQTKIANVVKIYGSLCTEMCEAEFMENSCRKKLNTELESHIRILWRGMAEMEACTKIGALLADGSAEEVQALSDFGRRLGLTARLADEMKDSLNIEGGLIHRLKFESVPLPVLFAAKSSEKRRLKIESILKKSDYKPSSIRDLLEMCFDSGAYTYLLNVAKKNVKAASQCLDVIKPSFSKDVFLRLNQKYLSELTVLCPLI